MTQRRNHSDAHRLAAHGLLALSTAGVVAATGTAAEADVLVYTSGLTTSLATSTSQPDDDVFFDFVAGTSSKDSTSPYQYRLASFNNRAFINSSGTGRIAQSAGCDASRYAPGDLIGSNSNFSTNIATVAGDPVDSQFVFGDSGYLGFAFAVDGAGRFGWADITVNTDTTVTLNRFAYETIPNAPIAAGSSVSVVPEANPLALLLLGAAGLGAYRLARGKQEAQQEVSA